MSLRARLLASLAVMLIVALVAAGFLLVELTRASLVDRVDADLRALSGPGSQLQRLASVDGVGQRRGPPPRGPAPATATAAWCVRSRRGSPPIPIPSPSLPDYSAGIPADAYDVIQQRPSVDGSMSYRADPPALAARQRHARGRGAAGRRRRRGRRARPNAAADGRARADRAARRRPGSSSATTSSRSSASRAPPGTSRPATSPTEPACPHDNTEVGRLGTRVRRDARPDRDELRRAAGGARRQGRAARSGCAGSSPTPRTSCARR